MLDYTILEYGDTFCPAAWVSEGNTVNYHKIYYCLSGSAWNATPGICRPFIR